MGVPSVPTPEMIAAARWFWSEEQIRLNARRLEHLATLGLDLERKNVLEVGGGMGDLSRFFLDRGCRVLLTDGRPENLRAAMIDDDLAREPRLKTERVDLDSPGPLKGRAYEVVFCYGVLHLLQRPARALDALARCSDSLLLLECEVAPGEGESCTQVSRAGDGPMGPLSERGSEMTAAWIVAQLRSRLRHVYVPVERPFHPAFGAESGGPARAVFVASAAPLRNERLRAV